MGMAASQARLLSLTARMSNNEFEQQSVAYSKQRLSENSEQINDQYLDALEKTKYQVLTGYNGTEACYEDITYNQLTGCNSVASGKQYLVKDNSGKVLVTQKLAEAFDAGNGDFNIFLKKLGYTQSDVDITKYAATESAIHDAWDKYLNSVGKSIYDVNGNTEGDTDYSGEHILGFGFTAFKTNGKTSTDTLDGYVTYNTAYAKAIDGAESRSLFKDDDGNYYFNRQSVVAKEYTGEDGTTKTGVFYQTAEQEGTDNYTQLLDVTYDADTGFTYTDDKGNEVTTKTLYASEKPDGTADISTEQKNVLTPKSGNTYESEAGFTYTVTEDTKALNYEGTTQSQRELYDYAAAITEAYYNNDNSKTSSSLTYDAQMVSYYRNIFNQMQSCGYTTTSNETNLKDSTWMVNQLKSGNLVLSYYSSSDKSFIGTTLDDDESITEQEDKSAIAIAEQEYTSAMDKIESQDKQFDMQLNKLDSEHTAMQTEYEQLQKVISKNVENSYKTFNA